MNILLVYSPFLDPRIDPEDVLSSPIGLYYLGAYLMEIGHHVKLLSWYEMGEGTGAFLRILDQFHPDVVGFSIFDANRWGGINLAKLAKERNPGVKVVFCGVGATFLWRFLLRHFSEIEAPSWWVVV